MVSIAFFRTAVFKTTVTVSYCSSAYNYQVLVHQLYNKNSLIAKVTTNKH